MSDRLSDEALDQLFRAARTANHYLDRLVPEALLREIWDLVKWAPTSANQEPMRIAWCVSQEAKDRLADCASKTNAAKIRVAPVACVIGMDLRFYDKLPELYPHTDARAWFTGNDALIRESAFRNSTLQGAYLIMAARALGLSVGPMSGFDNAGADAAFFAGTDYQSNFIATLGYIDPAGPHPRLPRLAFNEANSIL